MREVFHRALDAVAGQCVELCLLVRQALDDATAALLTGDGKLAERVVEGEPAVDELRWEVEDRVVQLMAQQQPVASDLRVLVGSMRMASDLERMGDLARHIAEIARMRQPEGAVPASLEPLVRDMARVAAEMTATLQQALADRDADRAAQLGHDDDQMDDLHRRLFTEIERAETMTRQQVVDLTLIGRYYERYADHAVTVGRRLNDVVNGRRSDRARL